MNFVFVYKSKERQNQRMMWSLPGWDSSQKCRCLVEHEAHLQPTMNLPFGEQEEGWKGKEKKTEIWTEKCMHIHTEKKGVKLWLNDGKK